MTTQQNSMENDIFENRIYAYIVEGVTDIERLKRIGCQHVIKTGGTYIRPDIMDFIKRVSLVRTLVIITDPDGPGRRIAKMIQNNVTNCIVVNADQKKAIYNGKVGIAQMKLEDLKVLVKPYLLHDIHCDEVGSLDEYDMIDLGLIGYASKAKREKIITHYKLPYTSAKAIEECLLMLDQTKYDLQEVLDNE